MKKLFTAITLLSGLLIQAQQNNCSTYIKQKTATEIRNTLNDLRTSLLAYFQ